MTAPVPSWMAVESELFGHERGAFTGAHHGPPGRFEQASGGTVFLDEVGKTPLGVQAKLLQVLQELKVRRVGARHAIRVGVRILAATSQDLAALAEARRFRPDLYPRLHVVTLVVPLRQRLADRAPLAHHFLAAHARRAQKTLRFGDEARSIRIQSVFSIPRRLRPVGLEGTRTRA
jgi:transcriptional regulator with GAF, ATPase, and Fis domain